VAVTCEAPSAVLQFLGADTPKEWLDEATARLPELLLDHANCELKAASTALGFIYRYPDRADLVQKMSRLAREELRHFEQVRKIMQEMDVPFEKITASRYAGKLRDAVRDDEPRRLLDMLITGALIEARSCERFAALVPQLPEHLGRYYAGLLASEGRHFEDYLQLARAECDIDDAEVDERIDELAKLEAGLICEPDAQFRFHSGLPAT